VSERRLLWGLIEIAGDDMREKADRLAERMREVLRDTGVKVARLIRMAEVRVINFNDSVISENIRDAFHALGGAMNGDTHVGPIRVNRSDLDYDHQVPS